MSYENFLKELDMFSVEKKMLSGKRFLYVFEGLSLGRGIRLGLQRAESGGKWSLTVRKNLCDRTICKGNVLLCVGEGSVFLHTFQQEPFLGRA